MKVKNFSARKLSRQLKAQGYNLNNHRQELEDARQIRTKKYRGKDK